MIDRGAGQRNQLGAAGGGRILDRRRRMADAIEEAVDLVVAERGALLVGLELGGEREVRLGPAHLLEQLLHRGQRARAGIADVEALALEVGELGDAGVLARQYRERLGMHREHRAQIGIGLALELGLALGGVELNVGLRQPEIEFAGLDGVDVEHRAAGRFDRAAKAGFRPALVHQPADRAADRVVDAGHAAGADGDEFLLAAAGPASTSAPAALPRRRQMCIVQNFICMSLP